MSTTDKLRSIARVGRVSIEDDCGLFIGKVTRGRVCTATNEWPEKSYTREAGDLEELIDALHKDLELLAIPR